jgi:hypothetical protein
MRVRVGVMLALAICVLYVPGSLYAHEAPPWFVTVKVAPPTGALIQLYAEGTFPYPITDDTRPIRLGRGEDTARFALPASAATDQWIYVRVLPDVTPGEWIHESFWSPCRQNFHEEPWGPPPPDLPWWAGWPPPYPNGHWGFLCEPNEVEIEVTLPGPPPVAENRPQQTAQGPQDCLNLVGSPINVTTGNMYTQQEDLAYPSAFGRFAFTRSYNSQSAYSGPLGLGWTHPYDFELQEVQPGVIRLRNGAGNIRFYELAPMNTNTYRPTAPARDTSTLVKPD